MTQDQDWISPKEAAAMLGYESVKYFTRHVLKTMVHRDIVGPKGGHRYLVLRQAVEQVREAQVRRPA